MLGCYRRLASFAGCAIAGRRVQCDMLPLCWVASSLERLLSSVGKRLMLALLANATCACERLLPYSQVGAIGGHREPVYCVCHISLSAW